VALGFASSSGVDWHHADHARGLQRWRQVRQRPRGGLKACCNLTRVAYEGGTQHAYFANDMTTLKNALSAVISADRVELPRAGLCRSFSVGTAVGASNSPAQGYEFVVLPFVPLTDDVLWRGNPRGKRWVSA